jgi:hypothetical protein
MSFKASFGFCRLERNETTVICYMLFCLFENVDSIGIRAESMNNGITLTGERTV